MLWREVLAMSKKARTKEVYILGQGPAPDWCRDKLTPYQRADGTTGFFFYGTWKDFELRPGDKLVKDGQRISVLRKEVRT